MYTFLMLLSFSQNKNNYEKIKLILSYLHFQEAVKGEYWRLRDAQGKPPGVMGWWPSRAVTFLENHDTGSTQVLFHSILMQQLVKCLCMNSNSNFLRMCLIRISCMKENHKSIYFMKDTPRKRRFINLFKQFLLHFPVHL